jgi:hypothetical protein
MKAKVMQSNASSVVVTTTDPYGAITVETIVIEPSPSEAVQLYLDSDLLPPDVFVVGGKIVKVAGAGR